MTTKTRVEENLEARELVFNTYAVNQGMNYIDEETDVINENVGLDGVDLFEMYANILMFSNYDTKDAGLFVANSDLEEPSDVVVPWSRAEKKMFNHMVNELDN